MLFQSIFLVVLLSVVFAQTILASFNATVTSRAGRTCTKTGDQPASCKHTPEFKEYVKKLVNEMKAALKPIPAIKIPKNAKVGNALNYYGSVNVCASICKF